MTPAEPPAQPPAAAGTTAGDATAAGTTAGDATAAGTTASDAASHAVAPLAGSALLDLVAVMDRLRSPGGCPWDAEQTHESLVRYLLEEAYEVVEAIETGDDTGLREELGDLLLQVVFHSRVAEERGEGAWSIDDVARGITEKLIRRHPHVFAGADAPTAAHVEANWEVLKAAEKQRSSLTDGVPLAQPALALVAKLHSRVRKARLDVPLPGAELSGAGRAAAAGTGAAGTSAVVPTGADLLALAVAMQEAGLDPEAELRAAARAYAAAIRAAEAHPNA